MLKSDTSFWNNWKDFSENKNCSNIEISDGHRKLKMKEAAGMGGLSEIFLKVPQRNYQI